MHSMDRVTDEEDNNVLAAETLRRRNLVNFDERPEDGASDNNGPPKQQRRKASTVGESNADAEEVFETQMVIVFANTVTHKALHWIVDKIRGKRAHGGAELLIRMEPQTEWVSVVS